MMEKDIDALNAVAHELENRSMRWGHAEMSALELEQAKVVFRACELLKASIAFMDANDAALDGDAYYIPRADACERLRAGIAEVVK